MLAGQVAFLCGCHTRRAKAENTRRAYRADWEHFTAFCKKQNIPALPASPRTVALYVAARMDSADKQCSPILVKCFSNQRSRANTLPTLECCGLFAGCIHIWIEFQDNAVAALDVARKNIADRPLWQRLSGAFQIPAFQIGLNYSGHYFEPRS